MSESTTESSDAERRTKVAKLGECAKHLLFCDDMSDVQFAIGRHYGVEKVFPAHRLIMGLRSPVFHTMFYGSLPDSGTAPISIPDIIPDVFANMLSYIYTDTVQTFTKDNVFLTLSCADRYDLPSLVVLCTEYIMNKLNVNNCLDILDDAVLYASAAPSILEKCLSLIDESATTIWKSDQFRAIGQEALCTILQRDTLTANEDTICASVDKWAENMCKRKAMDASSANRREVLGQAFLLIRFPLLTDAQLLDGPVKSGLLLQSDGWDILHYKHATIKPQLPFRTEPRQNVRAEGVISFTIPDVRKMQDAFAFSDPITVRKLLWKIGVHKQTDGQRATLCFYLNCSGSPRAASWTCLVKAEFHLLPWKTGIAPLKRPFSRLFAKDSNCWGFPQYISMEELLDPAKGYVNPEDFSLRLQVQMTAELPSGMECMQCAGGCICVRNTDPAQK
ncbi:BTB/POZ domain-containing protein 1-like [Paramacrobiotus metropolitanus]|uniref:BTB/POZ domain-containing protein 1-like n=1 Tax=Paramacrobiotus metropolitanus TaxID=2943436 RepID=UPI002445E115|nr:BTB/POZ domain-containing protein 1-like [Paramacrobiotus metropolitanus]